MEPVLPDLTCGEYLLAWWLEIGPALPGPAPLTHSEIRSWQENTGLALTPWEARTLRHLSREYLAELSAAEAADRPAPYNPAPESDEAAAQEQRVARNLRDAIAAKARA